MSDLFFALANRFSEQLGTKPVISVHAEPMAADEQGYSGARLQRLLCTDEDGKTVRFICKQTTLREINVMQALTDQKRGHTPLSCSLPQENDQPGWFIMQDIRSQEKLPDDLRQWKRMVASSLADIHTDNLGGNSISQLPEADENYWKEITSKISLSHFSEICKNNDAFARKYAGMLPLLCRRAETFVADMTAMSRDTGCMTVTHGDLQQIDGDHVRIWQGRPMIIDWGFCRYAPFYIDLVDYFTPDESMVYWEELRRRGVLLSREDFACRFHAASLYPAFIYLYPALMHFLRGDDTRLERLLAIFRNG